MGCKLSFPLSQKAAHERDCAFLQLKCPFHGQCVFNGSLADVVPHLAAEHAVTPVPVQPAGTLSILFVLFIQNLFGMIMVTMIPNSPIHDVKCCKYSSRL